MKTDNELALVEFMMTDVTVTLRKDHITFDSKWSDAGKVFINAKITPKSITPNEGGCCISYAGNERYTVRGTVQEAWAKLIAAQKRLQEPDAPDYDLSTVEGCKEAIRACGYKDGCVPAKIIFNADTTFTSSVWPDLATWQRAARWAIDSPAK